MIKLFKQKDRMSIRLNDYDIALSKTRTYKEFADTCRDIIRQLTEIANYCDACSDKTRYRNDTQYRRDKRV